MNIAIVLAGGTGTRVGAKIPKQFIEVQNKPILIYTLENFQIDPEIELWFGTNESDYYSLSDIVNPGIVIAEETYDDIKNLICEYDGTFGFVPDLRNEIECLFDNLDLDLEYDVERNPDKLEKYELSEIQFYQELRSLEI